MKEERVAVFTGTFDPITLGHLDVINRGHRLFDRLVVGIGVNPSKHVVFSSEERLEMVSKVVAPFPNVTALTFDGLAVDFVRGLGARVILRGLRTLSDMEYEFSMTLTNQQLNPSIETVFLMADGQYANLSSSLIKQVARYGGSEVLDRFVPPEVVAPILHRYQGANR